MSKTIPEILLNDGVKIPAIGFGTSRIKGAEGVQVIVNAIESGYRLIDTAYNYENEGAVGEAIRRSTIKRDELFITSKLPGRYHEYNQALIAIEESLYRTRLEYFDLYLIHWPNPRQGKYVEAWQALIDAKEKGLVRSIGVSNFLPEHIEKLIEETGDKPSVNQVELHPFFNQEKQRKAHAELGVQTQAWSPLAKGNISQLNETLLDIAQNHQKSVTQIILRWHYQIGSIPIPKSTNPTRQKENLDIFDFSLDMSEIELINSLSKPDGRLNNLDPAIYEEF